MQRDIISFLRLVLYPQTHRVFAVPNGGKRSPAEAAMLRATGVLAGVPDLEIIGAGRCWFIECKTPQGRLEPEQKEFEQWMTGSGTPHIVARSIDDVEHALKDWGIPTRTARLI